MNTCNLLTRGVAVAALLGVLGAHQAVETAAQEPPGAASGSVGVRQSTPALVFDSTPQSEAGRGQSTLPSAEEGVDRDGDGIPTLVDFCPDSPPGSRVDETGCTPEPMPWWMLAGGTAVVLGVGRLFWVPYARRQRRKRLRESRFERPPGTREEATEAQGPFQPPGAPIPWTAPPMPSRGRPTGAPTDSIPDAPGSFPLPEGWPPKQATRDVSGAPNIPASVPPASPGPPVPTPPAQPPTQPPPPPQAPPPEPPPGGWKVGFPAPPTPDPTPPPVQDPQAWKPALPGVPASTPSEELPDQPLFQSTPANPAGSHSWGDQPLHYEEPEQAGALELIKERPLMALGVGLVLFLGALAIITSGDDYVRPPGPVVGIPANTTPTVVTLSNDSVPTAAGVTGIPSALRMVDGDAQRGRVGQLLPTPVAVQVEDENGAPIPGVPVMFEATVGGGAVSPIATQTDSTGVARSFWTLGPQVVKQYVVARVAGSQAGVAFEADASPGIASRVAVVRGDSQTATPGEIVEEPVVVRVESEDGRPLEGVLIRFASDGGGQANPVEGVSDTLGEVSTVLTLGATGDSTVLRAEVAEAPGIAATIVARAAFPSLPARAGVAVGGTHSCALSAGGILSCWGGNQSGQLGSGGGRSPTPRRVSGGQPFADVSAGLGYTCGVGATGVAYCWGDNANAQLGDGTRAPKSTPRAVAADVRFRRVTAGNSHTCAISREGSVYCWGSNSYGQLGDGTRSDRERPTRTLGPSTYEMVAVGWFHSCSLTPDGRASCWGRNAFGQLGDGTTNDHSDPAPVGGAARYRDLTAGGAHTCGLGTDRVVYCWGQNNYGQLGDGGNQPRTRPTPVTGGPWRTVSSGGVHTCALDTSGAAFCWGRNTYGQLGDGTTVDQRAPRPVQGGLVFATIRASGAHTCGSTASGERYCWGYNVEGQLGDGTRENRTSPTRVSGEE